MSTPHQTNPTRRGIVLILVLAMLSILALLGVTFATLTGQAKIGAEYRARALYNPEAGPIFDFALDQIINDTNNPKSAIRGHGLLRDMYGIDGSANGYFGSMPAPYGWPFYITNVGTNTTGTLTQYTVTTNVPTGINPLMNFCPDLYGAYFGPVPYYDPVTGTTLYHSGWTLRLQQWLLNTQYANPAQGNPGVPISSVVTPENLTLLQANNKNGYGRITRTFEIVRDVPDSSNYWHVLTLSPIPTADTHIGDTSFTRVTSGGMLPNTPPLNANTNVFNIFELDGRYQRSFNGSGMTQGMGAVLPDRPNFLYNNPYTDSGDPYRSPVTNYAGAVAASYGYYNPWQPPNGLSSPSVTSMDEDYDAVDQENMYLGLQTADGSIVVPSYYRPNTVVYDTTQSGYATNPAYNDWLNYPNTGTNYLLNNAKRSKFLRPRAVDHPAAGQTTFPDLLPDTNGQITYDVDNDGDGVTDAVWLDLGYPVQKDASGKAYKPLFAITIIGLNGRLPLNTVGNLQLRNWTTGQPAFDHVSHVGYSPFEINPKYALTNGAYALNSALPSSYIPTPTPLTPYTPTYLLKNLLAGMYDSASATKTTGRYGEAEAIPTSGNYFGLPAAGRSHLSGQANFIDNFDSNYNTFDFYPPFNTTTGTYPEQSDLPDNAGYPSLPSERMRHFVNPLDITGNGFLMEFDQTPNSSRSNFSYGGVLPLYDSISAGVTSVPAFPPRLYTYGLGADPYGRHSFFMYFRPPGVSQATVPQDTGSNPYIQNPSGDGLYHLKDSLVNRLHGYEAHRNPAGAATGTPQTPTNTTSAVANREFMARAPFNIINGTNTNTTLPTFNQSVNSTTYTTGLLNNGQYPGVLDGSVYKGGSLGLNEDAQLELYHETPYDEPFDNHDLEWLYRFDPAAQQSLDSRLKTLLGLGRQGGNKTYTRLFSVDTWEPIHYAWYQNAFNATVGGSDNTPTIASAGRKINLNFPLPVSNSPDEPVRQKWCLETYYTLKQVLYIGRGVPAANIPAVELAKLGQWVVNIVDFRDPDATMTRFYNPDVILQPATSTLPASVDRGSGFGNNIDGSGTSTYGTGQLIQWGMEYQPVALNEVLGFQYTAKIKVLPDNPNTPTQYLQDHPSPNAGNNTNLKQYMVQRLCVELANMLVEDGNGNFESDGVTPVYNGGNASNLDLNGWGFVITADDPAFTGGTCAAERPNSVTGQLSLDTIQKYFIPIDNADGFGYLDHKVKALDTDENAMPNQDSDSANNFYVLSNNVPNGPNGRNDNQPLEGDGSTGDSEMPENDNVPIDDDHAKADDFDQNDPHALDMSLVQQLPLYGSGSGNSGYFWIHLLRPANPNLTYPPAGNTDPPLTYRQAQDANYFKNLVVVDSFRFPYTECGGAVTNISSPPENVQQGDKPLYSVGRSQPYRGGHAVPGSEAFIDPSLVVANQPAYLNTSLAFPYGYSEQCSGQFIRIRTSGRGSNAMYGQYYKASDMSGTVPPSQAPTPITKPIHHTLGTKNDQEEPWDFFPFNDRDFNSVAELLLVPGCPPGLFTKQFAEQVGMPTSNGGASAAFGYNNLPTTSVDINGDPLYVYHNDDATNRTTTPYPYKTPPLSLDLSNNDGSGTNGYDTLLPQANDLNVPHAFPYLPHNFYYSNALYANTPKATVAPANGNIGEREQPGWYTLLEFFEVPSPVNGAIGPVARGDNGDWLRQEVKPGLINLNLIYDEEVFFGLLDDPRLNNKSVYAMYMNPGNPPQSFPPKFVTSLKANGNPSTSMVMATDLTTTPPTTRGFVDEAGNSFMRAAFADFLKMRHGGSGFMGTFVSPYYLNLNGAYFGSVFPERPYHSLSAFGGSGVLSVYDTIMRPARLAAYPYPSGSRLDSMTTVPVKDSQGGTNAVGTNTVQVFPTNIPPRMLFQIPDYDQHPTATNANGPQFIDSPASETGNITPATAAPNHFYTDPVTGNPVYPLTNLYGDLFHDLTTTPPTPYQLGSASPTVAIAPDTEIASTDPTYKYFDRRQHPYFRTELMQKMMNLTTVRSNQFACWITVGFFEVVQEGNPQILLTSTGKLNPFGVVDKLGKELGAAEGNSTRFKLFCVIDRSKADGFNPAEPEDFNQFVVYSNRIK